MNIRKMKLALTVDLMNEPDSGNRIHQVKEAMSHYGDDVGSFKGMLENQKSRINESMEKASFSLMFEKCVLYLDLIRNKKDQKEIVGGFNLREKLS